MPSIPIADSDSGSNTAPAVHPDLSAPTSSSVWPPPTAIGAVFFAIAGLPSVWSTILYLWGLWTTDALKSIGMIIPLVSAVLIFRVWRSLDYEMDGTWWGALILVLTIAAVHLRDQSVLVLILTPQWSIFLPPHSLVAFAYTAGVVLLVGGARLFRAALFPIELMWFVNTITHIYKL
jgi:exosortase J